MLKKIFCVIGFIALFNFVVFSQSGSGNQIIASVDYKVLFKSNNQLLIDDQCRLDIGKKESYFYSLGEKENLRIIQEKMQKSRDDANSGPIRIDSREMLHRVCQFKTLKLYDSRKAIIIQYISQQYLGYVKDTLSIGRWKILKDIQTINGLSCHKAIMRKDTSLITAWFCTDVPFQDGPFYYYGLPGLIVRAHSSAGFNAELVSIKYNKDPRLIITKEPYKLVSVAQFNKAISNQSALIKNGHSLNGDEMRPAGNQ